MKKVAFAALAGLSMTTSAHAADMIAGVSPTLAMGAAQYEVTTGWYIRGDLGESLGVSPSVGSATIAAPPAGGPNGTMAPIYGASTNKFINVFGGGFGYDFGYGFRLDATFDHYTSHSSSYAGTVVCPYSAPVVPTGVFYDPTNTCTGSANLKNTNNAALINAYYELPIFDGFTPYVGAGAGVNFLMAHGALGYTKTSDGTNYAADLTVPAGTTPTWVDAGGVPIAPAPGISFGPQNWSRTFSQTKATIAVALMAGAAYHFNEWLTFDLGYRFLDADVLKPTSNVSHDFRLGLRLYAH